MNQQCQIDVKNCKAKPQITRPLFAMACVAGLLLTNSPGNDAMATGSAQDDYWNEQLRNTYFDSRPITESEDVVVLNVPEHAEDPAVVPVTIYAMLPQTDDRYIKNISLIIDKNPAPLAGRFMFTPNSGRADVSMRIRINDVTPVRAVAELNDGSLHMSRAFVNASGGCSAPVLGDLDKAISEAGKMKLSIGAGSVDDKPVSSMLRIRHPNITGMQTVGGQYSPAHFVEKVKIRLNGNVVFSAETDISISENPAFGFYIAPDETGDMVAEVTDSSGKTFTKKIAVKNN